MTPENEAEPKTPGARFMRGIDKAWGDVKPPLRMTRSLFQSLARVIGATAAELDRLHARLDAVEASAMRYEGPHNPAKAYAPGSVVTRGGSLWHAAKGAAEGEVPGDGATSWRLVAKAGAAPR